MLELDMYEYTLETVIKNFGVGLFTASAKFDELLIIQRTEY